MTCLHLGSVNGRMTLQDGSAIEIFNCEKLGHCTKKTYGFTQTNGSLLPVCNEGLPDQCPEFEAVRPSPYAEVEHAISDAESDKSNLPPEVLALEGMSTAKVRHFLANLKAKSYLEVGSWKGSTLVSASFGGGHVTGIDNFSTHNECGDVRETLKRNIETFIGDRCAFIEKRFEDIPDADLPKECDVCFYDGEHAYADTYRGITRLLDCLKDGGKLIVDDTNFAGVIDATKAAISDYGARIAYWQELPGAWMGSDPSQWHNGLLVAVIAKPVQPLVSVVLLTYNMPARLNHLNEAVESVIRQTYRNWELVIVNDSPGQFIEFDHPKVRVINSETRFSCLGEKRNFAVRQCNGDIIATIDDDDLWLPGKLRYQVEKLGDADYYTTGALWWMPDDATMTFEKNGQPQRQHGIFRKSAFDAVGGYDLQNSGEDGSLHNKLKKRSWVQGDGSLEDCTYIYRWAGVEHISANNGDGNAAWAENGSKGIPGRYRIMPKWERDYVALTKPKTVSAPVVASKPRSGAPKFAYYTCATDDGGAWMIETMIRSARAVGDNTEWHVCAVRDIPGAIMHPFPWQMPTQWDHMQKTRMLRDVMSGVDADVMCWFDSDNLWMRKPDLVPLIRENQVFVCMENDMTSPKNRQRDWHGPSYPQLLSDMRALGAVNAKYSTNGGFFMVRREAIPEFSERMFQCFDYWMKRGWNQIFDEPPLATVGHIMVQDDLTWNTHSHVRWTWDCAWNDPTGGNLPVGQTWTGEDWITGERYRTNPAIVHCMRLKNRLIDLSRVKIDQNRLTQQASAYPCRYRSPQVAVHEKPACQGGAQPLFLCSLHNKECAMSKYCSQQTAIACSACSDRQE